jgi:FG-GAP-like repeat/FG-GAP repeat/Bacterial Ig domain
MTRKLIPVVLLALAISLSAQITFRTNSYAVGGTKVLAADFNNDGRPDLIILDPSSRSLNIRLNNGDGTFGLPLSYITPYTPKAMAVFDHNRDGNMDVAVCTEDVPDPSKPDVGSALLVTYEGTGDGGLNRIEDKTGHVNCQAVVTADFNRDGFPDAAIAYFVHTGTNSSGFQSIDNRISVYFGNGLSTGYSSEIVTANIGPVTTSEDMWHLTSLAVGDFNGDGFPDLAMGEGGPQADSTYGAFSVQVGLGDGHFVQDFAQSTCNVKAISAGDIDQDGDLDVAMAETCPYASVETEINNGNGTSFASQHPFASRGFDIGSVSDVKIGDFNNDGNKDLAVAAQDVDLSFPYANNYLIIVTGTPGGGWAEVSRWVIAEAPNDPSQLGPQGLTLEDFDRNGMWDAVVSREDQLTVYLNNSSRYIATIAPPLTQNRALRVWIVPYEGGTQFLSSTTDSRQIMQMKVYVDHTSAFTTIDPRVTKIIPLSDGTHFITVKAWDSLGNFSQSFSYTQSSTCPAASFNREVRLCLPYGGSSVSSTVHVLATVTDSNKVSVVKIYVDGVVQYKATSKNVDVHLSMAPGAHRVTVKAWDYLGEFSFPTYFTVQ